MTAQVREAVGVFHDAAQLEAATDELLRSGFGRADLSVLASEAAVREKLGHAFTSTRELEDDPEVPTRAYVAREDVGEGEGALIGGLLYLGAIGGMLPVLASGGAIATAVITTLVGGVTGASFGAVLAESLGRHHAHALDDQLRRGGLLLWVRTRDAAHEARATEILRHHGGDDVHVHGLPDRPAAVEAHYKARAGDGEPGVVHEFYAGEDVIHLPDGHCYAAGRVFPTAGEARRFLDDFSREI